MTAAIGAAIAIGAGSPVCSWSISLPSSDSKKAESAKPSVVNDVTISEVAARP